MLTRYGEAAAGEWAAAVALRVLLTLFPIVLALLFFVSLVLRDHANRDSALAQLARILPGGSQGSAFEELSSTIDGVRQRTGILGALGLLGLLWSGSSLFGTIETALGSLSGFERRDFVRGKLMAFALILAFGALVVLGIVASAALAVITPIAERAGPAADILGGPGRWLLQIGIGILVGVVLNGMILGIVPRPRPGWRALLPGTLIAGVGFEALSLVWPLYLSIAGSSNHYGQTFGLLLVTVSYVYLLAQLLMVGAVVNVVGAERRGRRGPVPSGHGASTTGDERRLTAPEGGDGAPARVPLDQRPR